MNIDNLSEKELSDLLAKISAEKKRKADAKRKNYQKLRTKFLASVEKRVRRYVKDGQELKEWLRQESESYYNALKEYGELKRDEQLGFTVNNDTFRVQVKGNRVKRFDERADVAEKRLIDYLKNGLPRRVKEKEIPFIN